MAAAALRLVWADVRAAGRGPGEKGLSEREARGRRTSAEEADWIAAAEWVMGRMYDTNDVGEPEHRLAELGRWLADVAKGLHRNRPPGLHLWMRMLPPPSGVAAFPASSSPIRLSYTTTSSARFQILMRN